MATATGRPDPIEYASYFQGYISLVPGEDILPLLQSQIEDTVAILRTIPEERGDYRYAPGKWSIRDVLGHMIDCERIFAYRALRFSRNETTSLASFDQDQYAASGPYGHCKLADLIEEFELVRRTTLCLFRNLSDEAWLRQGVSNGNPMSVRAAAYITAGHELSHMKTLRERYLS